MIRRRIFLFLLALCLTSCGTTGRSITYEGKTEKYIICRGDTLTSIAIRHATTIEQLAELNNLNDPDVLEPGETIRVPTVFGRNKSRNSKLPVKRNGSAEFQGGKLKWPVDGGYLISRFGPRNDGFHDGLDIAADEGTNVYAAHDGTVVYSDNELDGYGEIVIVKSSSSLISIYAHNSKRLVDTGEKVKKGQPIAEVGQTGNADGPHLHFEIRVKDKAGHYAVVDPAPLLKATEKPSLKYRINESLSPLLAQITFLGK